MSRSRYGAGRPPARRHPAEFIYIVCDDSATAPAYFENAITDELGERRLQIRKATHYGATGEDVIEQAGKIQSNEADSGDVVWAIIDLEMATTSDALITTHGSLAARHNVNIAHSQPCFEVWILVHFASTGESFANCKAVLDRVKAEWKQAFGQEFPNKKAQADYRKLRGRITQAIANARKHKSPGSQSWTEVWKVFT